MISSGLRQIALGLMLAGFSTYGSREKSCYICGRPHSEKTKYCSSPLCEARYKKKPAVCEPDDFKDWQDEGGGEG